MHRFLLCLLLMSDLATAADTLTGTWTADARGKGGLGTTLRFADDGAVISILGAIVDFRYSVDGQTLTTAFHDPSGTNTIMHQTFQLAGTNS